MAFGASLLPPVQGLAALTPANSTRRGAGGNVAEMWVRDSQLASWKQAGIELRGYAVRTARPRNSSSAPPRVPPLLDADGHERFAGRAL